MRDFFPRPGPAHAGTGREDRPLPAEAAATARAEPRRRGPGTGKLRPAQGASLRQVAGTKVSARRAAVPLAVGQPAEHAAATTTRCCRRPTDPLGLKPPGLGARPCPARGTTSSSTRQPVVTENSVIYRHKNIVYCRSILNGELRWTNDLGGRAVWQNRDERQYPQEDVLVQDGLVFTAISKAGPSLVALDEVTGQLKWAYGPMVASDEEESRMRFEAAPAGGPRTIYAGYVLDNIEGETHTDTEYGVIAFESTTGRVQWRTPLCRLAPGKFSAGFAEDAAQPHPQLHLAAALPRGHGLLQHQRRRHRRHRRPVRADQVADALSLLRPAAASTTPRGSSANGNLVQYTRILAQPAPPDVLVQPAPAADRREALRRSRSTRRCMLCLDRRTGKVQLEQDQGSPGTASSRTTRSATGTTPGGTACLLGQARDGHLVMTFSGRESQVHLVDPETRQDRVDVGRPGRQGSAAADARTGRPRHAQRVHLHGHGRPVVRDLGAAAADARRPRLLRRASCTWATRSSAGARTWPRWTSTSGPSTARRLYYDGAMLGYVQPRADDQRAPIDQGARRLAVQGQRGQEPGSPCSRRWRPTTVPVNPHGPFLALLPRHVRALRQCRSSCGTSARDVEMVYDREAVKKALAGREDPEGLFARRRAGPRREPAGGGGRA